MENGRQQKTVNYIRSHHNITPKQTAKHWWMTYITEECLTLGFSVKATKLCRVIRGARDESRESMLTFALRICAAETTNTHIIVIRYQSEPYLVSWYLSVGGIRALCEVKYCCRRDGNGEEESRAIPYIKVQSIMHYTHIHKTIQYNAFIGFFIKVYNHNL